MGEMAREGWRVRVRRRRAKRRIDAATVNVEGRR